MCLTIIEHSDFVCDGHLCESKISSANESPALILDHVTAAAGCSGW